jgi:protein-L-isoaspartate(D-aspartate) O-methyltransferase
LADSSYNPYYWTREHLNHVICTSKSKILVDELLAKGFCKVDRKDFVPGKDQNIAYMDCEVDIGFAQKLLKPTTTAQLIKLLDPKKGKRYLVIGAGSGYSSAILGSIVGNEGNIIALERVLLLVEQMRANLKKYPALAEIVEPVFKDGRDGYLEEGPFDGILSCVAIEEVGDVLIRQVVYGANIVSPSENYEVKVVTRVDKTKISEKIYKGFVFAKIQEGVE